MIRLLTPVKFRRLLLALAVSLAPIFSHPALSAPPTSLTWKASPGTADWNTSGNWTPSTVPNSVNQTAFFATSTQHNPALFSNVDVARIVFNPGADSFNISTGSNRLRLEGAGFVNNSSSILTITVGSGGSLRLDNSSSGGNAAIVTQAGGSTFISNLSSAGASFGSIAGAGTYFIGSKKLTTGSLNTNTEVTGIISGAGGSLTKVGTGALTLSGNNSYSGGTTLNAGTLIVNNAHALGNGSVAVNGGMLMADPQPINVFGNYTQGAGGTLLLHINGAGAGQFDFLNATGSATLGGTLDLALSGYMPKVGDKLTIIIAQGGVSGNFAQVNETSMGTILIPELIFGPDTVTLEFAQGSFGQFAAASGLSQNQNSVARILDVVAAAPGAAGFIGYLDGQPLANLPGEFDLIAPEELTALYEISYAAANVQQGNLEDRMELIRAGSTGFTSALSISNGTVSADGKTVVDNKDKNVFQPSPENRWGVFISGNGDNVREDGDFNAQGFDFTTAGTTIGIDYRVCDHFAIGIAAGYNHTWTDLNGGGSIDVDGGRLGIYATAYQGGFYVNAYAGGGYNSYDTRRAALLGTATGSTDGEEFDSFLSGGYDFHCGDFTFGPIAAVQYTYVALNSYTEVGSLAPLNIVSQNQDSFRTNLGVKFSYAGKMGTTLVTPHAKASWQHEYAYGALPFDAQFAAVPGSVFQVNGPSLGRDSALVEVGVNFQWTPRISTSLDYDARVNADYQSHAVVGGCTISF